MRLHDLLRGLAPLPSIDPDVRAVRGDSRAVEPGDLFVARRGTRKDGAEFARDAVLRGAVAVIVDRPIDVDLGVPVLLVDDAALALGLLCDRAEGEPSREVAVTGVTGTNGKTTTAFLTAWLLDAAGRPSSLLGTVKNRVAGREQAAVMTTPDSPDLHRALRETRAWGGTDLVMEVSSHALHQRRVAGVRYRCAVFTNLTRDHLDYHKTVEAYGEAKALLFDDLAPDATAVLNAHDPFTPALARRTRARVVTYGWTDPASGEAARGAAPTVTARVHGWTLEGTRLDLRFGEDAQVAVNLPLIGPFNVENALAASAAAWSLGVEPSRIGAALEACQGVPGRLEPVHGGPGAPALLVDFAHTPDALERVLSTLRPLVHGRLHVVFGCGGDRDRGKRPVMGRAVERWADVAWLTSDNPRSERPGAILDDVLRGLERPERARVNEDRHAAIHAAVKDAGPGDLVLLAGKGHERGQIFADRTVPFDDREVAAEALAARAAA